MYEDSKKKLKLQFEIVVNFLKPSLLKNLKKLFLSPTSLFLEKNSKFLKRLLIKVSSKKGGNRVVDFARLEVSLFSFKVCR
jgi:hypothetical protein